MKCMALKRGKGRFCPFSARVACKTPKTQKPKLWPTRGDTSGHDAVNRNFKCIFVFTANCYSAATTCLDFVAHEVRQWSKKIRSIIMFPTTASTRHQQLRQSMHSAAAAVQTSTAPGEEPIRLSRTIARRIQREWIASKGTLRR